MAYRWRLTAVFLSVILWGCGETPTAGGPFSAGGSTGTGGAASGGTGGMGTGGSGGMGTGGNCGLFGCGGTGGMGTGGTGGMGTGGTGGMGTGGSGGMGTGGSGGAGTGGTGGGGAVECTTGPLCQSCPSTPLCDDDGDCASGLVCIDTGCDDTLGSPIMKCVFAGGGACESSASCAPGRECIEVPGEGMRCVKTTPGCDTSSDCVLGFACEAGTCVDRRVPCDPQDEQCPKNHLCVSDTSSSFCRRIQQGCESHVDCVDLAPHCEDIDGDLQKECAGSFNPNDPMSPACTNDQCGGGTPVCEAASFGSTTQCGQYGLCLGDGDCAAGFTCVALWPDGRKECVPGGGSCSGFSDCPAQQVCASPRGGGAPSCQAGL